MGFFLHLSPCWCDCDVWVVLSRSCVRQSFCLLHFRFVSFLESSVPAVFAYIQVKHSTLQKAIKKLNFNKIIAFIFYHIAKLVIIMLLFTHCTGIFISHCTSYNAKGDINNNTLLLQDRWLHCGHSGPLPLRFLFFMFTVCWEKTTILNSPYCFIFSLFLFFFLFIF